MKTLKLYFTTSVFLLAFGLPQAWALQGNFWDHFTRHNLNIHLDSYHKGGLSGPVHIWFEIYLSHDGFEDQEFTETIFFSEPFFTQSSSYIRPEATLAIPSKKIESAYKALAEKVKLHLGEKAKFNPSLKARVYFSKAHKNGEPFKKTSLVVLASQMLGYDSDSLNKKHSIYNRGQYYGFTYTEVNLRLSWD